MVIRGLDSLVGRGLLSLQYLLLLLLLLLLILYYSFGLGGVPHLKFEFLFNIIIN